MTDFLIANKHSNKKGKEKRDIRHTILQVFVDQAQHLKMTIGLKKVKGKILLR